MKIVEKLKSVVCVTLVVTNLIGLCNCASIKKESKEGSEFWINQGMSHLGKILKTEESLRNLKAKNIIIFIGDGMGPTTVTAGRIYKGQLKGGTGEEESLVFDNFPYTGMAKTYNTDKQVPDSAGTATALFTGVKTRYGVIGMDKFCDPLDAEKGKLKSIMDWAVDAGKRIGIVTTTRITHATPASTYANIYHRDWECDTEVPEESTDIFKDIARQLVEESPGNRFNVILGGGLSPMGNRNVHENSTVEFGGDTETICTRGDGRNLTAEWLELQPNETRKFVQTREQLLSVDTDNVDHLLGLFRNNHITYTIARQDGEPSLSEMTQQAIKVLDRPASNGFVLMVEGGRIDQAHHQNYARAALQEVVELDLAVATAFNMTNQTDTLIIVTADHSHALTLNGYPMRGTDILGFANKTSIILPYETLTYANGPGFWEHRASGMPQMQSAHYNTWIPVENLGVKRQSPLYRHMAALPLEDETHGGEDVAVYASGPGSRLVRGVFEQSYLAYVMSYAGCMGPAKDIDEICRLYKQHGPNYLPPNTSSSNTIRSIKNIKIFLILFLGYLISSHRH